MSLRRPHSIPVTDPARREFRLRYVGSEERIWRVSDPVEEEVKIESFGGSTVRGGGCEGGIGRPASAMERSR